MMIMLLLFFLQNLLRNGILKLNCYLSIFIETLDV